MPAAALPVARGRAIVRVALVAAGALGSVLAFVPGCGSDRKPAPASDTVYSPPVTVGSSGGFGADAGTKPPGCGQKDDGSHCDCVDVPLFTNPPNIYLVLDRSGSMEIDNKWDLTRVTVAKLLRGLGPRARFGAAMFPSVSGACAPGTEVMSTRDGDPPSAAADGPTTSFLLDVTRVAPSGGTPTAKTLQGVFPIVKGLPGKTFVILATDGAPNCNAYASCGAEACVPNIEGFCDPAGPSCCEPPTGNRENCLDTNDTVNAVAAYASAGIPVYVVGIPGSAPYASVLDELATVGRTALAGSPKYYRVDGTDLLPALRKVAAKIVATCTFDLTEPPADPGAVNVYLDDVVLPKDPANGWSIEGAKVTLLGSACARVLEGDVLGVRIIAGCPTVLPR